MKTLRGLGDSLLAAVWVYTYAALVLAFNFLRRMEQLGSGRNPKTPPRGSGNLQEK